MDHGWSGEIEAAHFSTNVRMLLWKGRSKVTECFFNRCNDKERCTCPQAGTFAFTAWLMAGPNPSPEEGAFWDNWKDEMKEGDL